MNDLSLLVSNVITVCFTFILDTYEVARRMLPRAENSSDLLSEVDNRPRKKRNTFDASSDDSDDQSLLPKAPFLPHTTSTSITHTIPNSLNTEFLEHTNAQPLSTPAFTNFNSYNPIHDPLTSHPNSTVHSPHTSLTSQSPHTPRTFQSTHHASNTYQSPHTSQSPHAPLTFQSTHHASNTYQSPRTSQTPHAPLTFQSTHHASNTFEPQPSHSTCSHNTYLFTILKRIEKQVDANSQMLQQLLGHRQPLASTLSELPQSFPVPVPIATYEELIAAEEFLLDDSNFSLTVSLSYLKHLYFLKMYCNLLNCTLT